MRIRVMRGRVMRGLPVLTNRNEKKFVLSRNFCTFFLPERIEVGVKMSMDSNPTRSFLFHHLDFPWLLDQPPLEPKLFVTFVKSIPRVIFLVFVLFWKESDCIKWRKKSALKVTLTQPYSKNSEVSGEVHTAYVSFCKKCFYRCFLRVHLKSELFLLAF